MSARPAPSDETAAQAVRFIEVSKSYDGATLIIDRLNLDIAAGEFLTFLGPSGSGKTTSLMMLAGFETPTSGTILLNGQPANAIPPHKRGLGFVFQNYALFPHMTVAENLAFPLEVRRMARADIAPEVQRALEMVDLAAFGGRKPQQLSGGQQQRVAVARALVFEPSIVLMDEPLGALDKRLREQLQYEIRRIHQELGVTVVYVTHDQSEAMALSDRIAIFNGGRIEQLDRPRALYDAPATAFVAGFVGENNLLAGRIVRQVGSLVQVHLDCGIEIAATPAQSFSAGERVVISVRPERLALSGKSDARPNGFAIHVRDVLHLGDHLRVSALGPGQMPLILRVPNLGGSALPTPGTTMDISFSAEDARALLPPIRPSSEHGAIAS